MYCLDTNIIIDLFKGDKKLKEKIIEIKQTGINFFITTINLLELYKGLYLFKDLEIEKLKIERFIETVKIIEIDRFVCEIFGREFSRLKKEGKITEEKDLIIASIAKANNLILITRNKKHFENIDIKIEVW